MDSDSLNQLVTAGATVAGGGAASAVVVRLLFATVQRQLLEISVALKELVSKGDDRHERLVRLEGQVAAAWKVLDDLPQTPRRRRGRE